MSDFDCCASVCANCYAEEADLECVLLDSEGQVVDEWPAHDFRTSHETTNRGQAMSTIPDYCPMCLRWMSQHVGGQCPDSVRDRLTLIARDVHQYDGGGIQALSGVGAQRIADVILSQFDVTSKAADREIRAGDPLDCPGCGYDPMAPHNGKGDCATKREIRSEGDQR